MNFATAFADMGAGWKRDYAAAQLVLPDGRYIILTKVGRDDADPDDTDTSVDLGVYRNDSGDDEKCVSWLPRVKCSDLSTLVANLIYPPLPQTTSERGNFHG